MMANLSGEIVWMMVWMVVCALLGAAAGTIPHTRTERTWPAITFAGPIFALSLGAMVLGRVPAMHDPMRSVATRAAIEGFLPFLALPVLFFLGSLLTIAGLKRIRTHELSFRAIRAPEMLATLLVLAAVGGSTAVLETAAPELRNVRAFYAPFLGVATMLAIGTVERRAAWVGLGAGFVVTVGAVQGSEIALVDFMMAQTVQSRATCADLVVALKQAAPISPYAFVPVLVAALVPLIGLAARDEQQPRTRDQFATALGSVGLGLALILGAGSSQDELVQSCELKRAALPVDDGGAPGKP